MASIVYLDAEDEITTAAARIRDAGAPRVGMVVPFASRVATSRINFRLLAREAQDAGCRLDIVAPDASARALAASAGLPVFSSVGEYEAALAAGIEAAGAPEAEPAATATTGRTAAAAGVVTGVAAGTGLAAPGARAGADPDPAGGLIGATSGAPARGTRTTSSPRDLPVASSRSRGPGIGIVVLVLALAVVLGFGGAAAVLSLPKAEITVTPVMGRVPPVSLTVTADPTATAADAAARVIPATVVEVPVKADGEFNATGTSVVQTAATGRVTFDSTNTVNAMPIARGTRVSTLDGVVFATTAAVIVPRATVSGSTITHGFATVRVAAIEQGPKGNVAARTINQVPSSLAALQVSVTNGAATSGGTRTEFAKITADDVNAATDQLGKNLQDQVAAALADPSLAPEGTTLFPSTATLGDATYKPDPTGLEGKQLKAGQTTFALAAEATATVVAVDPAPLAAMGDAAIRAAVSSGSTIVEDTIEVTVGDPVVAEDGTISYAVTATALERTPVDAAAIKEQALGLSEAEAKTALAKYGEVHVSLSPFFVNSVPTSPDAVTVTVNEPVAPTSGSSPAPSVRPSPATPSPSDAGSGESPVPSA